MASTGLVWFRRDLRLDDNPAWASATQEHERVIALFVLDPALFDRASQRRRDRMIGDLTALDARLREHGGALCVVHGDPRSVVPRLASEQSCAAVYVNTDVTPYASSRDVAVESALVSNGIAWRTSWGTLVHRPGSVLTGAGTLSQVFTPFHRRWEQTSWDAWPQPGDGRPVALTVDALPAFGTYPVLGDQADGAAAPGESGARARLVLAVSRADSYDDDRNTPSIAGTSELSIDLRFGTISPRQVFDVVGVATPGRAALTRQLAWRDWYAHLLFERPELVDRAMKSKFDSIEWLVDDTGFEAWTHGLTGYPFVDAGMRQLRSTGWMHNRVRMVTASFLVKNLLIDWRRGERHFRHVLLDADVSQNIGNWQWVAGTGPDASPYNRVFNPVLQGQRFDPDGEYVREWVPELRGLDKRSIHEPWAAPPLELAAAGVVLGDSYPAPIVDLVDSRRRVLAAYGAVS